jgi:hypothetical protein
MQIMRTQAGQLNSLPGRTAPSLQAETARATQDEFQYSNNSAPRIAFGALVGALQGAGCATIGKCSPHFSTVALTSLGSGVLNGVGGMMGDSYIPMRGGVIHGGLGLVTGAISSTLGATCGLGGIIAATFIGAGVGAVTAAARD